MPHADERVRFASFDFLERERHRHGETLRRDVLANGFVFEGIRVPLIALQERHGHRVVVPRDITNVRGIRGLEPHYGDHLPPADSACRFTSPSQ
jgi:hypothetical protein